MKQTEYSLFRLLKRLYWDLCNKIERQYYAYWLISQIPGLFGNQLRARFLSKRFKHAGKNLTVLAGARFRSMENLSVGYNVCIGNDNFIQALGGISIGNNVLLGPNVKIWSVNHVYQDRSSLICKQGQVKKPVIIGNDVWIASDVFITPGVHLPDGCVVAAGSVVTVKEYEPYCIIAG